MKFRFALLAAMALGCKPSSTSEKPAATAALTSGTSSTSNTPTALGSVRGVVRIKGDESPLMPKANQIPVGQCFSAHKMHSKVFRKAPDGGVADVLVAVTEYEGDLPLPKTPVEVSMADCALSHRTVVLTPGQEIHAKNTGVVAAMPELIGAPQAAIVVAVPGGDPIILTPIHAGRYMLVDASHDYATADVFVLNFPTATVTNEAGAFEITGVPAGEVRLSARLADAGLTVERRIVIEPNKTTIVDLEMNFDHAQWQATFDEARAKAAKAQ